MPGWIKNIGAGNYYYEHDHVTQEQYVDAITDEMIDYMLALQKIVSYGGGTQARIAEAVLDKYGKREQNEQA